MAELTRLLGDAREELAVRTAERCSHRSPVGRARNDGRFRRALCCPSFVPAACPHLAFRVSRARHSFHPEARGCAPAMNGPWVIAGGAPGQADREGRHSAPNDGVGRRSSHRRAAGMHDAPPQNPPRCGRTAADRPHRETPRLNRSALAGAKLVVVQERLARLEATQAVDDSTSVAGRHPNTALPAPCVPHCSMQPTQGAAA